ncbi:lysophospholipid acyltransferase family protein [Acidiferrobacter sp.]|uniref:lysophospholipid acyltransferase family protein n=1 Tax=Acidiferrobacter sp. TaxID=1872107 RepID=UPI002621816A|nr:lysophospholipid acyltransferase family protein [Acidiferrobacter sp.]
MTDRPSVPERVVDGLLHALAALPWPVLSAMGAGLGAVGYAAAVGPRRVARINIGLCFPELSPRARERLVRRHFVALGRNILATARLWWASEAEFRHRVRIIERASYDAAVARGRNIIFLAPHFLGLEIGGLRISRERPSISMYRAPTSVLAHVLLRRRSRFGGVLWRHDASLRSLIRSIRDHKPFYYLPDLDPGGADAVRAPFFGIPTPTLTALARIARLTDAVVLPCYTRKLPGSGGFEVTIGPPLAPFPTDDPVADAARMNAAIEGAVRAMPEQYLWTYKRFKRVRRDGRSPYE